MLVSAEGMDLFAVLADYMREDLIHDDEFSASVVEFIESPAEVWATGKKWILRRSYGEELYTINEEFEIEVRDNEHVRCTLKLLLQNEDAPREDTRKEIFKTRAWYGPELYIEVSGRQRIPPPVPSASSVEIPEDREKNKVENRILLMVKSFVKGTKILVGNPSYSQRQRLVAMEKGLANPRSSDAIDVADLIPFLEDLKIKGAKVDTICSTTFEHTKKSEIKTASMHNIGCYLTGITKHRDLLPAGQRIPSKGKDRPAYNCGRGVERILTLASKLAEYYGDDFLTSTFTFLEVGACGVARLGASALGDEKFFYDATVSLIDVSLRRLVASNEEVEQASIKSGTQADQMVLNKRVVKTVPVVNPFAFHAWFAEASYEATCEKLKQKAFTKTSRQIISTLPVSTIISQARKRSVNIFESLAIDESKSFILHNAQRLGKYITDNQMRKRISHYPDERGNVKLALRVLKGNALPEELTAASMAVVYIIVDILLDTCPKSNKRELATNENTASKKQRMLEMLPNAYANVPTGLQNSSLWQSGVYQNESESNSRVQQHNPYHDVHNVRSTNQEGFTPGFGDQGTPMHDTSFGPGFDSSPTNAWGLGNFGDGVDIDELLSQACSQFFPNGNELHALGVNTNSILPTPISQDDPDGLPRNASLDTMF